MFSTEESPPPHSLDDITLFKADSSGRCIEVIYSLAVKTVKYESKDSHLSSNSAEKQTLTEVMNLKHSAVLLLHSTRQSTSAERDKMYHTHQQRVQEIPQRILRVLTTTKIRVSKHTKKHCTTKNYHKQPQAYKKVSNRSTNYIKVLQETATDTHKYHKNLPQTTTKGTTKYHKVLKIIQRIHKIPHCTVKNCKVYKSTNRPLQIIKCNKKYQKNHSE